MDHRPTLSNVHISDAEDSYPNTTSPLRMQTTEPKPLLNGDQLLQMLSFMRKQMENQQTEIICLCEVTVYQKETTTCVQIWLLKQSEHNDSHDLLPLWEEMRGTPSPMRTHGSTHSPESSRLVQSETYEDDDDSKNTQSS